MDNNKLMNLVEVSKELGVCRLTVYKLIRSGALIAYAVGNQYRVSQAQLDKYLYETSTERK